MRVLQSTTRNFGSVLWLLPRCRSFRVECTATLQLLRALTTTGSGTEPVRASAAAGAGAVVQ